MCDAELCKTRHGTIFDECRALGRGEEGARTALPIWVDFMTKALATTSIFDFAQPAGIAEARIDPASL
jgi:penicillin-binding protein 1A